MCKLLILCCVLFSVSTQAALWSITYPRALDDKDLRTEYPLAVLTLALEKTGVKYKLRPSDRIMLKAKALRQLKESREVNVVWSVTDAQREKDLLPIRIPLTKGLMGWRVFLIKDTQKARFERGFSVTGMRDFIPVSGEEWPDTKILQANGFNVFTVASFTDAYDILATNRADFFPRSVVEVENELKAGYFSSDIILEPRYAIYYPTAMYFFVNKGNTTLARLIETGLKMALEDGSFDALFFSTYESTLKNLKVDERDIIFINNPLLPPKTPVDDDTLWYRPAAISQ